MSATPLLVDPDSLPARWLRRVHAEPGLSVEARLVAAVIAAHADEHGKAELTDEELTASVLRIARALLAIADSGIELGGQG